MKKTITIIRTIILIPIIILKLLFYFPLHLFKTAIWQRFIGNDIFISYARADGFLYANVLANTLAKKGYTCFIDQWENEPGIQLSNRLKNRIENTRMLVLLGTDGALNSTNIEEEIQLALKKEIQIIPIDFGNIEAAIWYPLIKGLPISKSISPISDAVQISESVTERITSSFKHVKRLRLLQWSYSLLFVLLFIGYLVLLYMFDQVNQQKTLNKQQFDDITQVKQDYYLKERLANRDRSMDTSTQNRQRQLDSFAYKISVGQTTMTKTYKELAAYYERKLKACEKQLDACKKESADVNASPAN